MNFRSFGMNNNKLAMYLLRIGMAFVLLYASFEIYVHPTNFLKFVPPFIVDLVPLQPFLDFFGVAEVFLALWLLSGWKGAYPALLSVLMVIGITVCNTEYFQGLFRNVAMAFGGLALLALEAKSREKINSQESYEQSK